jgi:hypothetical protein
LIGLAAGVRYAGERMLDRFRSLDTQGSTRSCLHEVDRPGLLRPLNWRPKYLASALILGPFTLDPPVIAVLGAALGVALSNDAAVATAVGLSVIAVLAVGPLAGRLWYARTYLGLPADLPSALRACFLDLEPGGV